MNRFPYRVRYLPNLGWVAEYTDSQHAAVSYWLRVPMSDVCYTRWGARRVLKRFVKDLETKREQTEYWTRDQLLGYNER